MKRKFIVSESQLVNLIKKSLTESNFANQEIVDKLLDKISQSGIDSLSDIEKSILKNPDIPMSIDDVSDGGDSCLNDLLRLLISKNLVDPEKLNIHSEFFEIYEFNNVELEFFNGENFLRMYCMFDDGRKVFMDFENYGQEDREEIKSYLKNVWEPLLPETEFIFDVNDEEDLIF